MAKNIRSRIGQGFEGASPEDLTKYLDWLRDSLNSAAAVVRRSVALMLLLMIIFQLLQGQSSSELTLGPLKVTRIDTILYFFPTLIAYFYLEVIVYTTRFDFLTYAFSATFKKWNSGAESNDLDALVTPWLPLYWSLLGKEIQDENKPGYHNVEHVTSIVLTIGSLVGALVYEIYAFYQLFDLYPVSSPLLWVNLFMSLGLIVTAILHLTKEDGSFLDAKPDRTEPSPASG